MVDHRIQWVTVFLPSSGHESPIVRIGNAETQGPRELEDLIGHVILELGSRTSRSLDDHLQLAVFVVRGKIDQVGHDVARAVTDEHPRARQKGCRVHSEVLHRELAVLGFGGHGLILVAE